MQNITALNVSNLLIHRVEYGWCIPHREKKGDDKAMWTHRLVCWGPVCRVGQNEYVAIHRAGISKWILPPSHPFLSTSKTKTRATCSAPLKSHLQFPISRSPTFLYESSLSFIGSSVPFAFGHRTQRYTCPQIPWMYKSLLSGWSILDGPLPPPNAMCFL